MRPAGDTNTYADAASRNTDANSDASFKSYADANGQFTSLVTHANTHGYRTAAEGDTKASADSASPAVSALFPSDW
jgi:hypothetical protein